MNRFFLCTKLDFFADEYSEYLDFGNSQETFSKGFISFNLLEMPDPILVHIKQSVAHEYAKFKEKFCHIQVDSLGQQEVFKILENDTIVCSFLKSIYDEWIILNKSNSVWGTFLFFIPLMQIQMNYRIHYGYKSRLETAPDYSDKYRTNALATIKEQVLDDLNSFKQHPLQFIKDFWGEPDKKMTFCEKLYNASIQITYACCYGDVISSNSKIDLSNAYYEIVETFANSILSGIDEIIRLKIQLKEFFDMRVSMIPKSFADYPTWMQHSLNETKQLFNCLTISQIVALEQDHLIKHQTYIKTCKMCGNYFVASKSNSAYCSRPNPEFENRTCKEACKRAMPSAQYELFPYYNGKRKVYSNWIKKQIAKHPEIEHTDISSQLHNIYEQWNQNAVNAMLRFDNHEMDRNRALELIELPSIEDRSPMLYKLLHK